VQRLVKELQEFADGIQPSSSRVILEAHEKKIFRSLKTTGERAIKGRDVSRCVFEKKHRDGILFRMLMEGRHSMAVGAQVKKRFEDSNEIDFAEVVKTKHGAYVILRLKERSNA
jgi:hypothetical protein